MKRKKRKQIDEISVDKSKNEENKKEGGEIEIPNDEKLFGEIKGEEIKNENKNEEGEEHQQENNQSQISNNKLVSLDKIEDIQKDPNDDNDAKKYENDIKFKISEIQKCEETILSYLTLKSK